MAKGYNGYALNETERARLLSLFLPKFADIVAHHVTHQFGVTDSLPPDVETAEIVGYASDASLEAYVIAINGSTSRPDGSTYHITWSLEKAAGRKPVHSNTVIKENGVVKFDTPVAIILTPKFFPF